MSTRSLSLTAVGCLAGLVCGPEGPRNRLLHTGEPTQTRPLTPGERFLEAVRRDDLAAARALLEAGADVRTRDGLGSSALLLAARWTVDLELVRFLHARAPELLDAPDATGRTPLSWAAQGGRVLLLRFLLAQGATVDARDASGRTPLFHAAAEGHTAATELLLAHGADVDARDQYGDTPLLLASAHGDAAMVRLLLAAGADRQARDQEGRTALQRALTEEVRTLLRGG
jgi:uncharacterized protein